MKPARKPSVSELTIAAKQIIELDANGNVANWQQAIDELIAEYSVSATRASGAVASAARRLRNARFAEEGTSDFKMLRIRLTEAQYRRAVIEANRETGGNLSALFRLRTLG